MVGPNQTPHLLGGGIFFLWGTVPTYPSSGIGLSSITVECATSTVNCCAECHFQIQVLA